MEPTTPTTPAMPTTQLTPPPAQQAATASNGKLDHVCSQCGASTAADQRYCIECGNPVADSRVPRPDNLDQPTEVIPAIAPPPAVPPIPFQTTAAPYENPDALRNKYLGLGAGGAAALIAIALGAGAFGAYLVNKDDEPAAAAVAAPVAPAATAPTGATTVAITSDWVAGAGDWTIVVKEIPKEGATQAQVDQIKAEISGKGLSAGVFDSDEVGGPTSSQYTFFTEQFESKKDADKALKAVKAAGYPDAKVVEISSEDSGGTAEKTSDKALEDLEKLPAEEQQKARDKLPEEVETEGEEVPEDNKKPGGGSDGVEIGSLGSGVEGQTNSTDSVTTSGFRIACEWPERANSWTIVAGERDIAVGDAPRPADALVEQYAAKGKVAEVTRCVDLEAKKSIDLVYVGWYGDQARAERALARIKELGFRTPYVAQVVAESAPQDIVGQIESGQPTATTTGVGK